MGSQARPLWFAWTRFPQMSQGLASRYWHCVWAAKTVPPGGPISLPLLPSWEGRRVSDCNVMDVQWEGEGVDLERPPLEGGLEGTRTSPGPTQQGLRENARLSITAANHSDLANRQRLTCQDATCKVGQSCRNGALNPCGGCSLSPALEHVLVPSSFGNVQFQQIILGLTNTFQLPAVSVLERRLISFYFSDLYRLGVDEFRNRNSQLTGRRPGRLQRSCDISGVETDADKRSQISVLGGAAMTRQGRSRTD